MFLVEFGSWGGDNLISRVHILCPLFVFTDTYCCFICTTSIQAQDSWHIWEGRAEVPTQRSGQLTIF